MSAMINGVLDCLYDGQLEIYLAENSMQENEKEHFRAGFLAASLPLRQVITNALPYVSYIENKLQIGFGIGPPGEMPTGELASLMRAISEES